MKVAKEFECALQNEIYLLCNRERYFTRGDNTQYEKMLDMSILPEINTRDIAVMIFICSSNTASIREIEVAIDRIVYDIRKAEKAEEEKDNNG